MYYTLLAMVTMALTPNVEIANALSFLIFIFWNVFSGFIIPRKVPPYPKSMIRFNQVERN
jgi:ABC-type multidrug transport system permease subunit